MKFLSTSSPALDLVRLSACALLLLHCSSVEFSQYVGKSEQDNVGNDTDKCREFLQELTSENLHYQSVEVPEDWTKPDGKKINVFYYTNFDISNVDCRTPGRTLVYFNGGPASPSHFDCKPILDALGQEMRLVFFDQRGTGCSSLYPSGSTAETVKTLMRYSSMAIVKDAEAIRKKILGPSSKWALAGHSYGSLVVHRYLQTYPESIEEAFAYNLAIGVTPAEESKAQIDSEKQLLREVPDNISAPLKAARNAIPNNFCIRNEHGEICGPAILDGGLIAALREPEARKYVEHIALENPYTTMSPLPKPDAAFSSRKENVDVSRAEHLISMITPIILNSDLERPPLIAGTIGVIDGIYDFSDNDDKVPSIDEMLFSTHRFNSFLRWNVNFIPLIKAVKADPPSLEAVHSVLQEHTRLRLHLYAGEIDTNSPTSTFGHEREQLGGLPNFSGSSGESVGLAG